ncbi:DUF202 domain-containing protein [Agathobacter sp.]|uniref:DUF202 domain-containing protein n=1 Tax=Agathobacter sp. TaxID=2021311 RepID=UPI002582C5B2|nr:DUF202 domain-containing protein [Agathobacter sp.]
MKGYEDFNKDEMILRDFLAYDRTRLALMRTVLSLARTALGLLASGGGLIILEDELGLVSLGYVLIVIAVAVMAFGVSYYLKFKKRLDALKGSSKSA